MVVVIVGDVSGGIAQVFGPFENGEMADEWRKLNRPQEQSVVLTVTDISEA